LLSGLPALRSDNSTASLLLADDPARSVYEEFVAQFGSDERVIVLVETPAVFEPGFLGRLRAFHHELEERVPHVEEVRSLVNARHVRGEGDVLRVEPLLAHAPRTPAEVATLERRVRATPGYVDLLVDAPGRVAALFVRARAALPPSEAQALAGFEPEAREPDATATAAGLGDREKRALIAGIREVIAQHQAPGFRAYVAGGPALDVHFTTRMARDVLRFVPAALAASALLLWSVFRRASAVGLPVLGVALSLGATLGAMGWLGIPASVTAQILPILVLVVATCNAVHLLAALYARLDRGESRERALAGALGECGPALLMSALLTAGGLASLATAPIGQVRDFGVAAPLGVLAALLCSLGPLPALAAALPLRARPAGCGPLARASAGLARAGMRAADRPTVALGAAAALVALAALGLRDLRFSQYGMRWFPPGDPLRVASARVDAALRGAGSLEVLIDTGRAGGLQDPAVLARIDRAASWAQDFAHGSVRVGKATSLVDVVKETHRALHGDRRESYAIPTDARLVAQELLLFESAGADDLQQLADPSLRRARLSLRVPLLDAMHYPAFLAELERGLARVLGAGLPFEITGTAALLARGAELLNLSLARSYLLGIGVIGLLLVALLGPRLGLLALVPNLVPLAAVLGLMGWLGVPLDNSSLLVGCVILSLADDDTIHFMDRFRHHLAAEGDVRAGLQGALETAGPALLFSALVLGGGFLTLLLSYMRNAVEFGALATFATAAAFAAEVWIAPPLLALAARRPPPGCAP
jgi:predicted RND superfamily exporter protein